MKLIKCHIENFGLLHNAEFSFSKGINCCFSEKGTGKTTLSSFIEAMLYGIGDTRRQLLDENPRKKYNPWQGGTYGGSLTIEVGRKKYTIERTFAQKAADDTFRLIDADTGKVSNDYGENIGEELFGIDRDGFLRTVFLSEKNLQGKNENKSISAKLSDLVGVDGDVGGYDDAVKLLEEKRKFYYKKGNTGEIANVKAQISECKKRLDDIERLSRETEEKEARLAVLTHERLRLQALEGEQKQQLQIISKQYEKRSHEQRYKIMTDAVKAEKEKLAGMKTFFKAEIPTPADIDHARDAHMEAERLRSEAFVSSDDEEYIALRRFFGGGTSFVELAEMERTAIVLREKENELARIGAGRDPISIEMSAIFKSRVPTRDEVNAMERKKNNTGSIPKICTLVLGMVLTALGFILGGTPGYVGAGIGLVLVLVSAFLLSRPKNNKEVNAFIREFCYDAFKSPKEAFEEIRKNIDRYDALATEKDVQKNVLEEEIEAIKSKITRFLEKFPRVEGNTMLDAINHIKLEFSRYYSLGKADAMQESGKLDKLKRSEKLNMIVTDFLAKFNTETNEPFSEIRTRLNDYNYQLVTVQRMESECDEFAVKYGVTGTNTSPTAEAETIINNTLREISEKAEAVNREYGVLERDIRLAHAEIERADELRVRAEDLETLLAKHTESLDIIRSTSLLLKEACDNITAKYLGKTKSKFAEYSHTISGIGGEYLLSTDFEIAKTDKGAVRAMDSYSRGTKDLYALAMRLSLIDALYDKEAPFIILDDPFISFDDGKTERAKTVLKAIAKDKQIIYFTCSKSRAIE